MNEFYKLHNALHELAVAHGIRVEIDRPTRRKDVNGWEHNAYGYTVVWTRPAPVERFTGTYRAGLGIKTPPQDFDILGALLMDANAVEYVTTPDEFGQELGYFPIESGADYRRMLDAFEECHRARAYLRRVFGEDYTATQEIAGQF